MTRSVSVSGIAQMLATASTCHPNFVAGADRQCLQAAGTSLEAGAAQTSRGRLWCIWRPYPGGSRPPCTCSLSQLTADECFAPPRQAATLHRNVPATAAIKTCSRAASYARCGLLPACMIHPSHISLRMHRCSPGMWDRQTPLLPVSAVLAMCFHVLMIDVRCQ